MSPDEVKDAYSQRSIRYFLDQVVINSHPEPKRFGLCAEPWQRELIEPKAAALDGLMGLADYKGPLSFLSVLARGHDKSSLEGRLLSGALCYSKRRIDAALIAADKDQAKLILEAMRDEAALNPWYGKKLEIKRDCIIGPAGKADVLPADVAGTYGLRKNLYILDECTNWKNPKGEAMWIAAVSGREKIPGSLLIVIENAGVLHSWQDKVREVAHASPHEWKVFEREGNLASWMTEDRRKELRKILPELECSRLLDNKWINAAEASGYLVPEDVKACEDPSVPGMRPAKNPRYQYVCGIDYGRVKDRTVMVLLHMDERERVVIDDLTVLAPTPGRPVAVSMVDAWVDEVWKAYRPRKLVFDPYQLEGTIQRLEKDNVPVERWNTRSGGGNMDLAMHLRGLISNRKVAWSPRHKGLSEELIGLVTKVTGYGFRFDHTTGQHDDQAVALAMAAIEAVKYPAFPPAPELPLRPLKPIEPKNPLQRFD